MAAWQIYADEAAEALRRNDLVLFVGAGISMRRRSQLPGWLELVSSMIDVIAGKCDSEVVKYITTSPNHYVHLLFNEVVLQRMCDVLTLPTVSDALRICLNAHYYSPSHRFFAWAMERFDTPVLTTNFDELIEGASKERKEVDHLHGTLSNLRSARFTSDNMCSPLSNKDRRRVRSLFAKPKPKRTLVVCGYGGHDEFDVVPLLLDESKPARLIWIQQTSGGRPAPAVERRIRESKGKWVLVRCDTDAFLRHVYKRAMRIEPRCRDLELDGWCDSSKGHVSGWWKARLKAWGLNLIRDREADVLYAWARILDHLRLYKLIENGTARNPAVDAYRRLINLPKCSLTMVLDAKARSATVGRTTEENDDRAFAPVIKQIERATNRSAGGMKKQLCEILCWTKHQYGIALQRAAFDTKNAEVLQHALEQLKQAAKMRAQINDAQVYYSEFQPFILAYYAETEHEMGTVDKLCPRWRALRRRLERAASRFAKTFHPEHCGNTWHNTAFIYQYEAERYQKQENFRKAKECYREALNRYEQGWEIRSRLRDLRMIAQSRVRKAQCYIGLAEITWDGRLKDASHVDFLEAAQREATDVRRFYARIPQEGFRNKDLQCIARRIRRLKKVIAANNLLRFSS